MSCGEPVLLVLLRLTAPVAMAPHRRPVAQAIRNYQLRVAPRHLLGYKVLNPPVQARTVVLVVRLRVKRRKRPPSIVFLVGPVSLLPWVSLAQVTTAQAGLVHAKRRRLAFGSVWQFQNGELPHLPGNPLLAPLLTRRVAALVSFFD